MKYRNVFKPFKKNEPIQYSDYVIQAVLNPRIKGLVLNINGGFDWIDQKYGFIKLLLQRGQIKAIKSGSDLLACHDYLNALTSRDFVNVVLEVRTDKKGAYASEKRILHARQRLYNHVLNYRLEAV